MTFDATLSVLHFLFVFAIVGALVAEMMLCRGPLDAPAVGRLARFDMVYGLSAGLLLIAGFARATMGAKGWAFYSGNPAFWIKIALFLAVGALSAVPTLRIAGWKKRVKGGGQVDAAETAQLRRWVHGQAMLLPLIVIAAALMARGIGN